SGDIVSSFQLLTIEPRAHSIRLGGDGKFFIRESLNRYIVEAVPIDAADETQSRLALGGARPIMRRFPVRDFFFAECANQNFCTFRIPAEWKCVAVAQRATIEAAKICPYIGGPTAEHNRHVDFA